MWHAGTMSDIRFDDHMSDSDALMWTIEQDPLLRSTILTIAVLESTPDQARLASKIDRLTRVIPRLRQRVVSNPRSTVPPRWEFDPNFDLDFHLRWVKSAGDGSLHDLFKIAEPIAMQGFDRSRPLWEFTVVEGLDGGRACLVMKIHHTITDGVGGVKIMLETFDVEQDPGDPGPLPDDPDMHVKNRSERFIDDVQHTQRRMFDVARRSLGTAAGAARTAATNPIQGANDMVDAVRSSGRLLKPSPTPLSPVMTRRSLSVRFDTLSVPLADAKAVAKAAGCTLNDAFVASVAGGFRRYHDAHGSAVDALRMTMLISIRNKATENQAGNQFSPARFPVPIDLPDPGDRMRAISELVTTARAEPSLSFIAPLAGLLNQLPGEMATAVFGSMLKGVDFITSNVPGAPFPLYLAGARIERHLAFGPLTGSAVNVTLLSYVDDLHVGFNIDPAAVPDIDVFMDCMRAGFDEVIHPH